MQKFCLVFLACSSFALTHAGASSQRSTPSSVLYDAKIKTPEPKLNPILEGRIMQDAAGMKDAQGRALCPPRDTRVRGVASGSFTRVKAKQTAYLVFGCRVTLEIETYGLLVYENSRLISSAHLTDGFGFAREFYGVRDLNSNGLSELALRWAAADGCCVLIERLSLLEWKSQGLKGSGLKAVGWDTLGELPILLRRTEGEVDPSLITFNYTLYVQKGPRPTFVGVDAVEQSFSTLLELEGTQIKVKNY